MTLPMPREPECTITHTSCDFVETDLDEMIAAAERSELAAPGLVEPLLHLHQRGMLADDPVEPLVEAARELIVARSADLAGRMHLEADRHGALDRADARRARLSGSSLAVSGSRTAFIPQPMSTPTAAGMIGALRRDHRADGRADAGVHVRHRGDVAMDDRQLRQVDELLQRLGLDVLGPDP